VIVENVSVCHLSVNLVKSMSGMRGGEVYIYTAGTALSSQEGLSGSEVTTTGT